MIRRIKREIVMRLAARKLERLVRRQRASFETRDFARRRAAALKHTRGVEA